MAAVTPAHPNHVSLSTRWRPLLALAAVPILSGCGRISKGQTLPDLGDRTIQVTATTGQVADLAREVGGGRVEVTALMGPGVDPHLFKASERNVEELVDSDAIFYNGLHLEGKLGELLERLSARRPVFSVGDAIPEDLLMSPAEFEGNPDPHVWFDPTMWVYAARAMGKALTSLDPSHRGLYVEMVSAYAQELEELDRYADEQFAGIPDQQRVLVTAHDAFGYLAARYGLTPTSPADRTGDRLTSRAEQRRHARQVKSSRR